MDSLFDLTGRVAIVTGGGTGIGAATALLFAREGATVVLADVDDAAGQRAAGVLVAEGHRCRYVRADVSREEDVAALIAETVYEYGTVDVLLNNAGVAGEHVPTAQLDQPTWNRIIAVNLTGTFLATKHAIGAMLAGRGGAVVNNASILGLVGEANHPAYSAAKGGVIQLTRVAAIEYARRGIRVNCVCPGFVETPLLLDGRHADAARAAVIKVQTPMHRLGQPAEIAQMALFLASERSSYLTGAIIPVDGGYVAR